MLPTTPTTVLDTIPEIVQDTVGQVTDLSEIPLASDEIDQNCLPTAPALPWVEVI